MTSALNHQADVALRFPCSPKSPIDRQRHEFTVDCFRHKRRRADVVLRVLMSDSGARWELRITVRDGASQVYPGHYSKRDDELVRRILDRYMAPVGIVAERHRLTELVTTIYRWPCTDEEARQAMEVYRA